MRLPGQPGDRRRAAPAAPGQPGRARGGAGAGDARQVDLALAPDPAAARGGLRLRRHPADLHGRRARPAQRPRLPGDPARASDNRWTAPAADGLGRRGAAAARPGHRRTGSSPG